MTTTSAAVGVVGAIRDRMDEPTSRGLARAVGRAVGDGALSPGDRLPPIRTLAGELMLSPTTVSAAWSLLIQGGTIRTDGRRGTVVVARAAGGPRRYRRALRRGTQETRGARFALDLSTGVPDPALLPDLGPALHRLHAAATPETYLDEPVLAELERELRSNWPAEVEVITVVDGALDAHDLITRSLLRFGERVAVENPCFPPLLDLLESAGVEIVPVALDDDGPVPSSVSAAVDAGVRALFVQPRAQNPTGVAVTAERADELAAVLGGADVVIVENDSAGAVASEPLVSLAGALPEQVVHVRSFAKSHGPDLRLAAVGGPRALLDPIVQRRYLGQGWSSRLLQRLLLDLLTHAASVRQVERARAEYARRRRALVDALAGHGVQVAGRDGVNLWLPVVDESAALVGLASRGIGVAAGAPFLIGGNGGDHVRVTCGLLADGHNGVAAELAAAGGWEPLVAPR